MAVSDLSLLMSLVHLSDGEKIEGRKRLQKLVCVLKHKYKIPFSYKFKPYYYGPYSEGLTEAVDTLVGLDYLRETKETLNYGISKYTYVLTDSGKDKAGGLNNADQGVDLDAFKTAIRTLGSKSTEELVSESKSVSQLY